MNIRIAMHGFQLDVQNLSQEQVDEIIKTKVNKYPSMITVNGHSLETKSIQAILMVEEKPEAEKVVLAEKGEGEKDAKSN